MHDVQGFIYTAEGNPNPLCLDRIWNPHSCSARAELDGRQTTRALGVNSRKKGSNVIRCLNNSEPGALDPFSYNPQAVAHRFQGRGPRARPPTEWPRRALEPDLTSLAEAASRRSIAVGASNPLPYIPRALCKRNMKGLMFKNCSEFQDDNSRAFNRAWGPSGRGAPRAGCSPGSEAAGRPEKSCGLGVLEALSYPGAGTCCSRRSSRGVCKPRACAQGPLPGI